jgi:uncharacterized membrane protein
MRLWIIPLGCLVAGVALGIATLAIDRATGYHLISTSITGGPTAVQTLLSTILSSLITLISVVLTVMTVAVQLAMGQFSPRIVTALLREWKNQLAFGVFAGATAFYAVALRELNGSRVPGLTVLVAYGLALASLAVLILYVDSAGRRLRASGLIDLVGDRLHDQIEQRFPHAPGVPDGPADVIAAPEAGLVADIDVRRLVALAVDADAQLTLEVRMGDFVPAGGSLMRVDRGDPGRLGDAASHVRLGDERTHGLDPAYGFRKLVDIGTRSASDDPTTTVEALHRIHDCLRQLAVRTFPSGRHCDADGVLRVSEPVRSWDDYVLLAFEEIRLAAASSPQIARRLRAALLDLKTVASPERQPALDEQLDRLDAEVRRHFDDEHDVRIALAADPLGLG